MTPTDTPPEAAPPAQAPAAPPGARPAPPGDAAMAAMPASARYAALAARRIGAHFEALDQGGWLFRISRSGRSFLSGCGAVASYPVNGASAHSIARDKAHAKTALAAAGLPAIPGRLFFARPGWEALRPPASAPADALAWAETLGWPVFCKPNQGARGDFAERIAGPEALADYITRLAPHHDGFLVERVMAGDELRVTVLDGRPRYALRKAAPALAGDGRRSLRALLDAANADLAAQGISPWPAAALGGGDPGAVPAAGARVPLLGRRNASAAGGAEALEVPGAGPAADLAAAAAAALGLRLAAVDLFAAPDGTLTIIELNANPGMETLERMGRIDIPVTLWAEMLEEALGG